MKDDTTDRFFAACEASGMKAGRCADCGCRMWSRDGQDKCPPCRGEVPDTPEERAARMEAARKDKGIS